MNPNINKEVILQNLGLMDYKQAWDYQEKLFKEIIDLKIANRKLPPHQQQSTPNYLLLVEHPHVYTLGKSGKPEHLLLDEEGLEKAEASYYPINRGGDITYHGPGQLVAYPLFDLENFFTDIHKYLRFLEEAVIDTIDEYGLSGGRIDGLTGVWIDWEKQEDPRKICAMGVKSSRWVTMHGLALNVNTQLDYFKNIIPCGIDDKAVTSMQAELKNPLDLNEVQNRLIYHLSRIFGFKVVTGL
jgi:lipoyl(octanoyl) transferase